jgi:hypothetical protein
MDQPPGPKPSPSSGVILLAEVAARTTHIVITCRACGRSGRLRTDQLLREHGPNMPMPTLLRILAGACPRLDSPTITDRCDAHCPTLAQLFGPNPAWAW